MKLIERHLYQCTKRTTKTSLDRLFCLDQKQTSKMQCLIFSYDSSIVFFVLSVVIVVLSNVRWTVAVIKLPGNETVPAVLVFGDSIVDTGNNNDVITPAKCNFPPYGRDFQGGKPTGRFSNGKVPSDFIVEELGIKETLPAYKDPNLRPKDIITGVCFAVGGTGYDPLTPKVSGVTTLQDQLEEFKAYIEKLKGIVGEERTKFVLEKSVVVVVAGSNDIDIPYFFLRVRAKQYAASSYADLLVENASTFVKGLYEVGARRIAVFGAPPLGCVPVVRTVAGGLQRECGEDFNKLAQLFNSKLSAKLDSLNRELPSARFVYVDTYDPLLNLINNYQSYGFEVANRGCCGTGNIETTYLCNKYTPHTCPDASKFVFWDGFHPSERAYKILITSILPKYVNLFFCGKPVC